jgi:cytochrome b561
MFMIFYNIGLIVTALMLVVRGIPEVLNLTLSAGMNGMMSGIAGLGHISLGVGMILLIVAFKKSIAE